MNKEDLIEKMPQKPPFLFIDTIEKVIPGENCITKKTLNKDEYYLKGHFPSMPIMPGCLLIECMAQTAELILISDCESDKFLLTHGYLVQVKDTVFYSTVIPGQELWIEATLKRKIGTMFEFKANVRNHVTRVAKGNLVIAMELNESNK